MSHRPCAQCGAVFREPDDNDAPVRCYACGATFPSFNVEQAMAAMAVPLTYVEAPGDGPPAGPLVRVRYEDGTEVMAELHLTHPPLVGKVTIP